MSYRARVWVGATSLFLFGALASANSPTTGAPPPPLRSKATTSTVSRFGQGSPGGRNSDLPLAQPELKISNIMQLAQGFYNVGAEQKQVQSTEQARLGVLLDSFSVTGSVERQYQNSKQFSDGQSLQQIARERQSEYGAQLVLALTTWFQARSLDISADTHRSVVEALKMQNAVDGANAYLGMYSAYGQLVFLQAEQDQITKIKSKNPVLNAENQALLNTIDYDVQLQIQDLRLQLKHSAADIAKLTGQSATLPHAMGHVTDWNNLVKQVQSAKNQAIVDLTRLEKLFPIPTDWQSALNAARMAPTLIQADLAQKSATNAWYLTLSGTAPKLVFAFQRSHSYVNEFLPPKGQLTNENMAVASINISIGGGIFNNLNSNQLLEEAAQLSYRATEAQIRDDFQKDYDTNSISKKKILDLEAVLEQSFQAFQNAPAQRDAEFTTFVQVARDVAPVISQLYQELMNFISNRIGIEAEAGSILQNIPNLKEMGE